MTETRPIQPTTVGAFRFNTDSAKLEYFDGDEYVNITTDSSDANTGGGRALFGGGCTSPGGSDDRHVNTIDFVNISTTGSATDFGENINHRGGGGLSDQTRGIFHSTNG